MLVVKGVNDGGSRAFPLGCRGKFPRKSVKAGFDNKGIELAVIEPGWLVIAPEGAGGRGGTAKSLGERRLSSLSIPPSSKKRGGIEISNNEDDSEGVRIGRSAKSIRG